MCVWYWLGAIRIRESNNQLKDLSPWYHEPRAITESSWRVGLITRPCEFNRFWNDFLILIRQLGSDGMLFVLLIKGQLLALKRGIWNFNNNTLSLRCRATSACVGGYLRAANHPPHWLPYSEPPTPWIVHRTDSTTRLRSHLSEIIQDQHSNIHEDNNDITSNKETQRNTSTKSKNIFSSPAWGLGHLGRLGINPNRRLDLRISLSFETRCLFLVLGLLHGWSKSQICVSRKALDTNRWQGIRNVR